MYNYYRYSLGDWLKGVSQKRHARVFCTSTRQFNNTRNITGEKNTRFISFSMSCVTFVKNLLKNSNSGIWLFVFIHTTIFFSVFPFFSSDRTNSSGKRLVHENGMGGGGREESSKDKLFCQLISEAIDQEYI